MSDDPTINWDTFDQNHATTAEGECLLWLLSHKAGVDHHLKAHFFASFVTMVAGDLTMLHRGRRPSVQDVRLGLNRMTRAVKQKHPSVDIGQRVAA